jgi:hypothetical protein
VVTAIALLNLSSCAHSQKLVGITVSPQNTTITLTGIGQVIGTQFTALGTYIHPPETKDVTAKAVWTTNTPQIIAVDSTTPGLINTTGEGCGTNLGISASVYSNPSDPSAGSVMVGTATMNVSSTGGACP